MKTLRRLLCQSGCSLICGLLLAPQISRAGFRDFFFPKTELETVTVTDMSPTGSLRRTPTAANPVYYAAVSGGYRSLGAPKPGEKPVARGAVTDTMMKVLAKRGYLPASAGQRVDLVLVWTWGTLNAARYVDPQRGYTVVQNRQTLMRFMGSDKLGMGNTRDQTFSGQFLIPGLVYYGNDQQRLYDTASEDLYIAVITAYDPTSKDPKNPIKLWTTRVACPSRGFWLDEALPGMLAIAGPFIGRDTEKPVWVRATDKFRPDIQLGDTKLVEYLESKSQSVVAVGVTK
ncbi:MAG: hypothetical protein ABIV50_13045 [Opitutus sp.]